MFKYLNVSCITGSFKQNSKAFLSESQISHVHGTQVYFIEKHDIELKLPSNEVFFFP